jgi:hypothetical protein
MNKDIKNQVIAGLILFFITSAAVWKYIPKVWQWIIGMLYAMWNFAVYPIQLPVIVVIALGLSVGLLTINYFKQKKFRLPDNVNSMQLSKNENHVILYLSQKNNAAAYTTEILGHLKIANQSSELAGQSTLDNLSKQKLIFYPNNYFNSYILSPKGRDYAIFKGYDKKSDFLI